MTHWMMPWGQLAEFQAADASLAAQFFDTPNAYVAGGPFRGYSCHPVALYTSFDAYARAWPGYGGYVCYDPEAWAQTPVIEKQHPRAFLSAFASLAHSRGAVLIAAPSRDIVFAPGADCTHQQGEPIDTAYLRCGIPGACADADIFLCQSQGDQPNVAAYTALVTAAHAQQPAGQQLWAELTSQGTSTTDQMVAAYKAVKAIAAGFWVNTDTASVATVAAFFRAVAAGA